MTDMFDTRSIRIDVNAVSRYLLVDFNSSVSNSVRYVEKRTSRRVTFIFTARCYTERGAAMASCPSVCLLRCGIVVIKFVLVQNTITHLLRLGSSLSAAIHFINLFHEKPPNFRCLGVGVWKKWLFRAQI